MKMRVVLMWFFFICISAFAGKPIVHNCPKHGLCTESQIEQRNGWIFCKRCLEENWRKGNTRNPILRMNPPGSVNAKQQTSSSQNQPSKRSDEGAEVLWSSEWNQSQFGIQRSTVVEDTTRNRRMEKFRRNNGWAPGDSPEQIAAAQRATEAKQAKREWRRARDEAAQAEWDRQQAEWNARQAASRVEEARRTAEAASRFRSDVDMNNLSGGRSYPSIDDSISRLKSDTLFDSSSDIRNSVSSIDHGRWSGFDSPSDTSWKAHSLESDAKRNFWDAQNQRQEADRLQQEAEEKVREIQQRANDTWNCY